MLKSSAADLSPVQSWLNEADPVVKMWCDIYAWRKALAVTRSL